MKKRGMLSFVIYTVLFALCGIMTLKTKLEIDALDSSSEGLEGLGLGLGFVLFLVFTIVAAVPFVLKLIHVISGWRFFGFLSSLAGIALIGIVVYNMVDIGGIFDFPSSLPVLALLAALGVATVTDIVSLRR